MVFEGKIVVVTGGAQGIGEKTAELFVKEGATVVIGDINKNLAKYAADKMTRRFSGNASAYYLDVTRRDEVNRFINAIISQFGRIDVLVNNAGICKPAMPLENITEEEWLQVIGVNLMGTIYCVQASIPVMKTQQSGCIINMSSSAAETGGISVSPSYAVSKSGVIGLTKSLAKYLGEYNITVNALAPGIIDTEMIAGLKYDINTIPLRKYGDVEDVAEAILFLASPSAKYITGTTIDINGGLFMK